VIEVAKILVVDDDPLICRNLTEILKEEGHSVEATTSGKEAVKLVEKGEFEMAIIDLVMPEISGMDLLTEFRKKRPGLLVIMITAFVTVGDAVTAMKKGAIDYIGKPFKTNEIQITVRRALEEANFKKRIQSVENAPDVKRIISSLDGPIRRAVIVFLEKGQYSFTEIMNGIDMDDATKFNFHLRKLKSDGLLYQDEDKKYTLTESGKKALDIIKQLETQ
jgi:CheY-like chemotaxis protein